MKITLYTVSDCKFSTAEKQYLQSKNLTFDEKNLETNREFLTEMLAASNNFAGTPVTKIEKDDGQIVVLKGFTQEEFDATLFPQAVTAQPEAQPTSEASPFGQPVEPVVPEVAAQSPVTPVEPMAVAPVVEPVPAVSSVVEPPVMPAQPAEPQPFGIVSPPEPTSAPQSDSQFPPVMPVPPAFNAPEEPIQPEPVTQPSASNPFIMPAQDAPPVIASIDESPMEPQQPTQTTDPLGQVMQDLQQKSSS